MKIKRPARSRAELLKVVKIIHKDVLNGMSSNASALKHGEYPGFYYAQKHLLTDDDEPPVGKRKHKKRVQGHHVIPLTETNDDEIVIKGSASALRALFQGDRLNG